MRICFVSPFGYGALTGDFSRCHVGGAEVQQSMLAPGLAARGHEVSMISMDFGQREGDVAHGVRLIKMHAPEAGLPVLRFLHPRLTGLWAALKRADADIYYQRCAGASLGFVAAFARRHGRRTLFSAASDSDFDPALPQIGLGRDRAIYRAGLRWADEIVVQTARQSRMCAEHFGRESVQINSCYRPTGRHGRPQGPVLWIGSVKPAKRPEMLLDLARRLPRQRFVMIGAPAAGQAHFDELAARARALGNVEMVGFLPLKEVEARFEGASLLVSTSAMEGFPNVFLQAWSSGVPTVSFFDVQARLGERPVGVVVDDLDAMAGAIGHLAADAAAWQDASATCRTYFDRHHDVDAVLNAYEAVLQRMSAPSHRREALAS